jgi:hypothetical protein
MRQKILLEGRFLYKKSSLTLVQKPLRGASRRFAGEKNVRTGGFNCIKTQEKTKLQNPGCPTSFDQGPFDQRSRDGAGPYLRFGK